MSDGKPRKIISYAGVQLQDAREHLRVVFADKPLRGVSWLLHDAGFQKQPDNTWMKRMSPQAIFAAQDIFNQFYGEPDAE